MIDADKMDIESERECHENGALANESRASSSPVMPVPSKRDQYDEKRDPARRSLTTICLHEKNLGSSRNLGEGESDGIQRNLV